jgi:dipeptidyl aminopeptidase/acylaminoacyl peptidase
MKTMFTAFHALILCLLLNCYTTVSVAASAFDLNKKEQLLELQHHIKNSEVQSTNPFIKRNDFLNKSNLMMVRISPNGEYLSYVQRVQPISKNRFVVWLFHINENKHEKLFTFKNISHMAWSGNSQALLVETYQGIAIAELSKADQTGGISPKLIAKVNKKRHEAYYGPDQFNNDYFYIKHRNKQNKMFELHRYNFKGQSQRLFSSKDNFDNFYINKNGKLTLLKTSDGAIDATGKSTLYRIANNKQIYLWQCEYDDPCKPYSYDENTQRLQLVTNENNDISQLVEIDLATSTVAMLSEDTLKKVDINSIAYAFYNNKLTPVLANYYHAYNHTQAIDQKATAHLEIIYEHFKNSDIKITLARAQTPEHAPWLIEQQNSNQSSAIFTLYHPKNRTFTTPFDKVHSFQSLSVNPLTTAILPKKQAISYLASDGMTINAYLTLPPGIKIKTAPMVTLVHGGPWSRDKGNYDRRVQFLANRGYIVFQPNFRGSKGFGRQYMNSASKQFGDGRVQQDITDGVMYLLDNGVGDKNRLAIVGHSFGGFSVLAGLSFTPNLFQFGFAAAAPTDLSQSIEKYAIFEKHKRKTTSRAYFMKEQVVDWRNSAERKILRSKSPDMNTENIIKPLFIWAGAKDKRVFAADIKDYASRVNEHNELVTLLVDKKSGHSPRSGLSQQAYFYALEFTLSRYLGGSYEKLDVINDNRLIKFLKNSILINKDGIGI